MPNVNLNLIPIIKQGYDQQLVNARLLHQFLESGHQFADWVKERIESYSFIEGRDFFSISRKSTGGRRPVDYLITLDMAKELAMLERNDKGRQARQYFIECEKKLRRLQGRLQQTYSELEPLLKNCRNREHDGVTWYAVNQLRRLSNKGYVKSDVLDALSKEGIVMRFTDGNMPRWYVREDAVPKILNVKPSNHLSVAIVNILNTGGMQ